MNTLVGNRNDGTPFLVLVLEPGNLERLRQGAPIFQRVEDYFPDGIPRRLQLIIGFSETPVADAREFAGLTEVFLDERAPRTKQIRPHCPECKSTIEQLGALVNPGAPLVVFCPVCGCTLGLAPSGAMGSKGEPEEHHD